jgi:hypothetical protein
MAYGSLNVNTRYNIIPCMSLSYFCSSKNSETSVVSAGYHRRFDGGVWFLVPTHDSLNQLEHYAHNHGVTRGLLQEMKVI